MDDLVPAPSDASKPSMAWKPSKTGQTIWYMAGHIPCYRHNLGARVDDALGRQLDLATHTQQDATITMACGEVDGAVSRNDWAATGWQDSA